MKEVKVLEEMQRMEDQNYLKISLKALKYEYIKSGMG